MSEKRYEHQIFHIAHPLVRKLTQQAIDVRKFRVIYPVLFDNLKNTREEVTEQLILELKGPVQEYFEYKTMVELEEQLAIILSGRRLVDQALGYIQTGKIHLHDEFLVKNILTKQQLTDIFEKIRLDFWSNFIKFIPEFSNAPESIQNHSATLMKVLHTKGWYLPNLLPAWSVEELFVDYITVFLKYNKYKTSHQDSGKQYPTKDELKESLKNIIGYDQPLFNDHGTFIDFYTNEQGQRSSNYLGVNIDLDGSLHSLPYILSEFIVSYSSRWIDYSRKGQKGGLGEGDDMNRTGFVGDFLFKLGHLT